MHGQDLHGGSKDIWHVLQFQAHLHTFICNQIATIDSFKQLLHYYFNFNVPGTLSPGADLGFFEGGFHWFW